MSLGSTVVLVTAGLAVAGGTSYVSLMYGDDISRAPRAPHVAEQASASATVDHLSAYLDASFASLQSSSRSKTRAVPMRLAAADVNANVAPTLSFAERFDGMGSVVTTASAVTRSIVSPRARIAAAKPLPGAPKVHSAVLRMDEREAPAAAPNPYQVASYAPMSSDTPATHPFSLRSDLVAPPARQSLTSLVRFANAPFPYDGIVPGTGRRFLNVVENGRRGHRTFRGRVLWEDEVFSDPRVLLHIPKGFDITRPSVMVVFFHGHGATLSRDVLARQEVTKQISEAGVNAVLVAPQLAFDAADSSPGKLWEQGGFARLVNEAGEQLTKLYGDPRAAQTFAKMPIIVIAYSGGYLSAATSLERGGLKDRVRGVVLLDALYGELGGFASWITSNRPGFFVSAYTGSTRERNQDLEHILSERDVKYARGIKTASLDGNVVFLPGEDGIRHRDFVNHAWTEKPIRDILVRLPEYRL